MNKVAAGLIVLGAVHSMTASAQEAPRPSLARQKVIPPLPADSNIKVGPILFRFSTALRTEFVDNVNLSNGTTAPIESDILLNPQLGIDAAWPLTKLNSLRFHTTLGLTKYLAHPNLGSNNLLISPDSELRFDVYVGDFKMDLHDQFSLQEDPVNQSALSNVSKFGIFTNVAGFRILWDLNDVVLSSGFDHTSAIATGSTTTTGIANQNADAVNHTTDQISASALFTLNSTLSAGWESVASVSRYPDAPQNDATRFSAGPFAQLVLTSYTRLSAAFGYQGTFYDTPVPAPATSSSGTRALPSAPPLTPAQSASTSPNSYYANLTIAHRLNRYYQDQLSVGHESAIGLFSQGTETTYLRYSSGWQLTPMLSLSTALFYEETVESGAQSSVPYQRFGLSLSTSYRVTKKLSASLMYQFIERISVTEAQSYRQNRIGLSFSYQF